MKVLMLGWEFPPFIAGGLGTACYGLTRAMDHQGLDVTFVLPKRLEASSPGGVRVVGSETPLGQPGQAKIAGFVRTSFVSASSTFSSPYGSGGDVAGQGAPELKVEEVEALRSAGVENIAHPGTSDAGDDGYGTDMIGDTQRYAGSVLRAAENADFDVIHAHDWMTFPAGIALSKATGKPLVVHVHSTEFDRSGDGANEQIRKIEQLGMDRADRIIAVSVYTRNICVAKYGIDSDRIDVVYNGCENGHATPPPEARIDSGDKIVLFLGRITMQKGPEYFIRAAKRVLEKRQNVKFVIAGAGDMATRVVEEAAALGIGHKVLFTGFLRGADVDRVYRMADLYVMPSVSEPFGIAPLEAIRNNVPVIISKTSGVSEVLTHALKVDFWDVDEMANKIVAVLRHPPLGQTLRQHGPMELRSLTWEGAAQKVSQTYERVLEPAVATA